MDELEVDPGVVSRIHQPGVACSAIKVSRRRRVGPGQSQMGRGETR